MPDIQTENTKQEQVIHLKDGRTIFKTHNGFKSFVKDNKGTIVEITDTYYNKAKITINGKLSPNLYDKSKQYTSKPLIMG
jgi:hypothetical protein